MTAQFFFNYWYKPHWKTSNFSILYNLICQIKKRFIFYPSYPSVFSRKLGIQVKKAPVSKQKPGGIPCSMALTLRLVILMTSSKVIKEVWSEASSINSSTALA